MLQTLKEAQKTPLRLGRGPVLQLQEQDLIEMKKAAILEKLERYYGNNLSKWQQLLTKLVHDPRATEREWTAATQLIAENNKQG